MSSGVSGFYTIAEAIQDRIREQAAQELKLYNELSSKSAALEAEMNARLEARQRHETERQHKETNIENQAIEEQMSAEAKQQAVQMEAQALLSEAAERIERMADTLPEKAALLEKLQCMENSVELFGVNDLSIENIRQYVRETIPETMMRIYQQQEAERLEETAAMLLKSMPAIEEDNKDFVSLQVQGGVRKTEAEVHPWTLFLKRVELLAARQLEFGGFGADELLQEMQDVPENQRSLFMLQHGDEVAMWESEMEPLVQETADREQYYQQYEELRQYCLALNMEAPALPRTASTEKVKKEYERLMEMYVAYQNQRYLEKNFREVFEAHGLQFEGMEADSQNLTIEFAMDEESYVRVLRSMSGAFEMVFVNRGSGESSDERRRATEKAHGFCSLMPGIYADLEARGIHFEERVRQEPEMSAIQFDGSRKSTARHEKKLQAMQLK
ncbi:MAG: hypothetical protein IKK75_09210 [Clostridia bacterium]|nr:hypothetical protein [Clostridia bacterium]